LLLDRMLETDRLSLIDCQVPSSHLLSLGASFVPRAHFVASLDQLCEPPRAFENWPERPIKATQLVQD